MKLNINGRTKEAMKYCLENGACTKCGFSKKGRLFGTCRPLVEDMLELLEEKHGIAIDVEMNKQDINNARCDIEWVEEYILGVGEGHKQVYVDALERVQKLLKKIEKAADALE